MEAWAVVKDFDDYLVSSEGAVRSVKRGKAKQLSLVLNAKRKYVYVSLQQEGRRKNFLLHRLVAEAFVENKDKAVNTEVDHKDFDRKNNAASNLEWVSRKENMRRQAAAGRSAPQWGHHSKRTKLSANDVAEIFSLREKGKTQAEIAEVFSMKPCSINLILNKKRWVDKSK